MANFDPAGSIVFDLDAGRVSLAQAGDQVLLPASALNDLCARLDESALRAIGSSLGTQAGTRMLSRLGVGSRPSMQAMVDELGGELSLSGLGALSIERWGQALVARIQGCPIAVGARALLSAFLERALYTALGRELVALSIEDGDQGLRYFLCSRAASRRMQEWLAAGNTWGDALVRLHASAKGSA